MTFQQQLQLLLLFQHRPASPLLLFIRPTVPARIVCVLRAALRLPLPPLDVLPSDLALLHVLVVPRLVARVVHAHHAAPDGRAAKVVHSQVCAALVLILEPAEAPALAGVAVAGQLQEDGLAELGEDGNDVAFGELVGQAAEVDEGGVTVVDVPGGIGGAGSGARWRLVWEFVAGVEKGLT